MLTFNIKAPILDIDDTGGGEPLHPAKILLLEWDEETVTLSSRLISSSHTRTRFNRARSFQSSGNFTKSRMANGMLQVACALQARNTSPNFEPQVSASPRRV